MDDIVTVLRDGLRALRDEAAELEARAESPDGLVAVTVGWQGELRELRLDPRIYRTPDSQALATAVVATVKAAGATVDRQAAELLRERLGRS